MQMKRVYLLRFITLVMKLKTPLEELVGSLAL